MNSFVPNNEMSCNVNNKELTENGMMFPRKPTTVCKQLKCHSTSTHPFKRIPLLGSIFTMRSMPRMRHSETMRIDRPFLYMILDRNMTGLFWGSMRNL